MAENLKGSTPHIQTEYNPERKLTKKEIDKLPPKEKQRVLDSMAPEDFIPAGYGVDDIDFSNAVYKKLNLDPEKMESLRKARLSEYKEQQKKRDKPIKESTKIDKIFEAGGPKAGDVLNVSENGKVEQYYILENDGKNMVFTIGKDGARQPIGLRQAKEFLSKPGISFTFEEKKKKRVHTQNEKRDKNSKQDEEIIVPANLNPETPNGEQEPDIETKNAEAKLKLEIAELEKEIAQLEEIEKQMEKPRSVNADTEPEQHEEDIIIGNETETENLNTEQMSKAEYEQALGKILISENHTKWAEQIGLHYVKTESEGYGKSIHTKIVFGRKNKKTNPIYLNFDIVSGQDSIEVQNAAWDKSEQNLIYKNTTGRSLSTDLAKDWAARILRDFIKQNTGEEKFRSMHIENGMLIIEQKV